MKPRNIVAFTELMLLAVLLLVHAAALVWACSAGSSSSFIAAVISAVAADSIPFGQGALLSIIAVMGPGRWFIRWPLVAACVVGLMTGFIASRSEEFFMILMVQVVVLTPILIALRLAGFRIDRQLNEPSRRVFQFSIRGLLLLTVAIAVALAISGAVRNLFGDASMVIGLGSLGLTFAAVALLSLWLLFPSHHVWLVGATLCLLTPFCGTLPAYIVGHESDWLIFVSWTCGHVLVLVGTLSILRMCDLRLVWRRSPLLSFIVRRNNVRRSLAQEISDGILNVPESVH